MRLLLIEDDKEVASYIIKGFQESGHVIDHSDNGRDGLFLATTETYDALIIDRMIPEPNGLKIIQTLRNTENTVPILILSALDKVDERVKGLRSGGDDYLVKPFAFSELLARTEILARRTQKNTLQSTLLTAKDLELNLLSRTVKRSGEEIPLKTQEFKLLEYMLENKGRVLTRTMLLEHVWDYNFNPQTNVIDVHISRLRQKIDNDFPQKIIKTIRGAGYIIENEE